MNYGELLQQARENKKLTVKDVSRLLKIPVRAITAFEEMNRADMPARVYALPFLKKYIQLLGVIEEIPVEDFFAEVAPRDAISSLPDIHSRKRIFFRFSHFVAVIVFIIGISVSFYFYHQIRFLIRAPLLNLEAPAGDTVLTESFIDVKGNIDPDSSLTLNGRPIYSKETGEFNERIYLVSGLHTLEFEAENEAGKIAKVIRYILVK